MYVSLLPVVEACVVVAVPGRVGEVRVAADEPEAVDLDPGVLARRLDAPATVNAVLEQGGRVLLRGRARSILLIDFESRVFALFCEFA